MVQISSEHSFSAIVITTHLQNVHPIMNIKHWVILKANYGHFVEQSWMEQSFKNH